MLLGLTYSLWIDLLQTLAVITTLFFLIRYTNATIHLKDEAVKQTRLSMRPFVVVAYSEHENQFKLINYGQAVALNVHISDVILIQEEELIGTGSKRSLSFKYNFQNIDLIPPGSAAEVRDIKLRINDQLFPTQTFDLGALIPRSAHRSFKVKIRYENTENEIYETEGNLGEKTYTFEKMVKIS